MANNESLPFKEDTFDCYLANLSLMLVDNHMNQLAEAFRVSKRGAHLGFTVWGRKDYNNNFTILDTILEKHGLGPKEKPKKTNYDLGKDPEALKKQFESMGFSKIRMWYEPMNFNYTDFEDYFNTIFKQPGAAAALKTVDEKTLASIKEDVKNLYEERMGHKVLDPKSFEVMIITAQKN